MIKPLFIVSVWTTIFLSKFLWYGKTFNCSLNNWFLIIIRSFHLSVERPIVFLLIIIIFFFYFFLPPNFDIATNVCFSICRLDIFHIVSYSLCAFTFNPAKPNTFLCKSYLPIHCLSSECISFVTKKDSDKILFTNCSLHPKENLAYLDRSDSMKFYRSYLPLQNYFLNMCY